MSHGIFVFLFTIALSSGAFAESHTPMVCKKLVPMTKKEIAKFAAKPGPNDPGCKGSACPNLECRDARKGSWFYMKVDGGKFRGSKFGSIGYSDIDSAIRNSDMRDTTIEFITSSNLSGSDFRGAVIESIESAVHLNGADFRGATIKSAGLDQDGIDWTGAIYDSTSKLPFDDAQAASRGMIKKDN